MKKQFCLLALMLPLLYFAQINRVNFTITPEGTYEIPNSNKNYYVFQYDGMTQSELYSNVLMAITRQFADAKDIVSEIKQTGFEIQLNLCC